MRRRSDCPTCRKTAPATKHRHRASAGVVRTPPLSWSCALHGFVILSALTSCTHVAAIVAAPSGAPKAALASEPTGDTSAAPQEQATSSTSPALPAPSTSPAAPAPTLSLDQPQRLLNCPIGMAPVLGGRLHAGLPGPHALVNDFCMDRTEVTADQYRACVRTGACPVRGLTCGPAATYASPAKADHPINCVDQEQAQAFCRAKHKRLPSNDEWEWAAGAGSHDWQHPWGDSNPTSQPCWSVVVRRTQTCPVGSSPGDMSPDGIVDLAGNVSEWTGNAFSEPGMVHALERGYSWRTNQANPTNVDVAFSVPASLRLDVIGFRCAATPTP